MAGSVISINISLHKGAKKLPVDKALLIEDHGIKGDAHAGTSGHRQVSLLAIESIEKMRALGLNVDSGAFAENITTKGVDLLQLKIGDIIRIGSKVKLEITQIGKVCHERCAIYYSAGDCVMPKEGVFAKVLEGGTVKTGDCMSLRGTK